MNSSNGSGSKDHGRENRALFGTAAKWVLEFGQYEELRWLILSLYERRKMI